MEVEVEVEVEVGQVRIISGDSSIPPTPPSPCPMEIPYKDDFQSLSTNNYPML